MNFVVDTDSNKILGVAVISEQPNELIVQNNTEEVLEAFRLFRQVNNSLEFDTGLPIEYYLKYNGQDIVVTTDSEKADVLSVEMLKRLDKLNSDFILSRYSLKRQNYFLMLKIQAMEEDRTDVIAECNKLKNWMNDFPMEYFYQKEAEVFQMVENIKNGTGALEDLRQLEGTWDFEQFGQYDPVLTIASIRSMLEG